MPKIPLVDVKAQYAPLIPQLEAAFRATLESGRFILGPEVEAFAREAGRRGARALLTTAKDAVKLRGAELALPCYVVETELEFEDEAGLLELLRAATRT